MKNINVLFFSLLIITFINTKIEAQSWMQALNGDLDTLNFFRVQKDFNNYWEEHSNEFEVDNEANEFEEKVEEEGIYGRYKEWERFWDKRINADGSFPKSGHLIKERRKYFNQQKEKALSNYIANWTPFLTGNTTSTGRGRIDCIAINPVDSNIIWAGSPTGGLWKSIDGGENWTTNTDTFEVIGISDIAINPQNPDIIYVATGDRDSYKCYSTGVLKSIDGGITWQQTGLNTSLQYFTYGNTIYKLIINPNNPNILFAATRYGLWRTTDSGINWTSLLPFDDYRFKDAAFQPNNPTTIYTVSSSPSSGVSLYKSTNSGNSFSIITTGLPQINLSNTRLAITAADPNYLYLLASNQVDYQGLYLSTDAGNSFNLQSNSPNILGYSCIDPPAGDGQGWYDLALSVSPVDKDIVFVGGISIWKSFDAGVNWTLSGCWDYQNPHADQHCLVFSPHNPNKIYAGNDGSIDVSNNLGASWLTINNNLQIMQYYNLGSSASNPSKIITGSQDNGTHLYQTNIQWVREVDGDGALYSKIDYSNDNILYGSKSTNQSGNIQISIDNGGSWTPLTIPAIFTIHPSIPSTLFSYHNYFYKSFDRGNNWFPISTIDNTNPLGYNINFSGTDTTNIYLISPYSRVSKYNLFTGAKSIITPDTLSVIDFVVSPTDTNKIWVTLIDAWPPGKNVFQTTDGGINWTNISGTLPQVSYTDIVYENGSNDGIYISSDIGIFYRNASMTDWVPWVEGLPNVIINQLEIQYGSGKLRAATYGRGVWESNLYPLTPEANFTASLQSICQQDSISFSNLSTHYPTSLEWVFPGGTPATSTLENPTVLYTTTGSYDVQLIVSNQAGSDTIILENYVTVNPLITATITPNGATTFCQGNSVTLTANPADSYLWSTGATTQSISVSQNGNYFVTLSNNNGCSAISVPTTIIVNPLPTASITPSGEIALCQGDSILLTANSANYYLWNNDSTTQSINVSASGNYSVTITDGNECSDISSPTAVTVNPFPSIPIISANDTILTSSSINGNQWYLNGNIITGATLQSFTVTQNGIYTVVVTINGCSVTSSPYNFTTISIQDIDINNSIIIIPNPNNGIFYIDAKDLKIIKIKIYNTLGEIIYESKNSNSKIDLSTQSKGNYFIEFLIGNKTYTKQLIIQ